jgi:hypothetical protein
MIWYVSCDVSEEHSASFLRLKGFSTLKKEGAGFSKIVASVYILKEWHIDTRSGINLKLHILS